MDKKIVGVFGTEESAILAIKRLQRDGYTDEEISVIAKKKDQLDRIDDETDVNIETENNKGAAAAAGAVTGGVLGGVGALLLELGVFAIPGVGPFLAAGPIAVTLTGILAGGVVGGVSGVLISMGFSEEDAKEYGKHLDDGNILVLVEDKDNRDLVNKNFTDNNSLVTDMYTKERYDE